MRTEIDRWDPEPVYAQLADILRGQIERGELVPRQPLPSETYLVQHYGVSAWDGAPLGGRRCSAKRVWYGRSPSAAATSLRSHDLLAVRIGPRRRGPIRTANASRLNPQWNPRPRL